MRPSAFTSGKFRTAPISDIVPRVTLMTLTAARAASEPAAAVAVAVALSAAAPVSGGRNDRASANASHFERKASGSISNSVSCSVAQYAVARICRAVSFSKPRFASVSKHG